MNLIQKLRELQRDITDSGDGLQIVDAWATLQRLLPRATTEHDEAARIIREKDPAGLSDLLDRIESPTTPKGEEPDAGASAKEMKDAMHAFRKRLKLARLNDESRLGGRYTSGGKKSKIDAVEPPREFPARVWRALVQAGKLRDEGGGFFSDPEEPSRLS